MNYSELLVINCPWPFTTLSIYAAFSVLNLTRLFLVLVNILIVLFDRGQWKEAHGYHPPLSHD